MNNSADVCHSWNSVIVETQVKEKLKKKYAGYHYILLHLIPRRIRHIKISNVLESCQGFSKKKQHNTKKRTIHHIPLLYLSTLLCGLQIISLWPRTHGNVYLRFCIVYCSSRESRTTSSLLEIIQKRRKTFLCVNSKNSGPIEETVT